MEDRGCSIKWYYQTFNPSTTRTNSNPLYGWKLMLSSKEQDKNKFGADAVDRANAFATDNHNQYTIHKQTRVDNKVYHNSKRLGYYDCVTAQEATIQIIRNDYTSKLPAGGQADEVGKKWEKEGIVGKAMEFKIENFSAKRGDVVTSDNFKLKYDVSANLINESGITNGTTFFTLGYGKDFHGAVIGVTIGHDAKGNLTSSFTHYDQVNGAKTYTAEQFNAYVQKFLFLNSTSAGANGTRIYMPGGTDNISDGNQKIVARKINKVK